MTRESSSPRPLLSPHARLRWDERAGQTLLLAPERGLLRDVEYLVSALAVRGLVR